MGESAFICTFCSKEFANKSRLEIHLKMHTGEKTHVCSQCNRAFRTASDLKVHFRTHTGEKPYKCKFCDQAFAVSRNLTAHTRIHTGERPFVCSLCGKAFTQKSALNVHMRIHTGDKPFQCIFCAKQFAYSNSLKMHLKEHTRESSCNGSNSSQDVCANISAPLVTPTTLTPISSHLVGRKRGRGGRRGSRGNRRKREPFKETMLGFSDYTQQEEEHLYTCSICSKGFDQIEVLAEHWKSHNEESDSEKSDDDEKAEPLSSDMPATGSSLVQSTIKIEAGTSVGSRTRSRKNTLDPSSLPSEKEGDSHATSSIYNNLREIIAKSLGVTQVSNGQRHSKAGNQENSTVTFGSAAKLYQPPSLLRGYQTTKLSSDRIFGRLKHHSSVSNQDEMESPTFQSPLGVDPAASIKTNSENTFGSLASITEKVEEIQDDADAGSFSSPSLNGSFYVGNNPSKKSCFPEDQDNDVDWENYPTGDSSSFSYHDDRNIALGQIDEKQLTNPDPNPYHGDRNIALGQIDEKQLTNPDPNPYHGDRNIALGQIDEKQLTNPDPYHGDRNIALGQIDEKQLTNPDPYHDDRNIALGQIDEKQLTNPNPYHDDRNIALGQIDEKQLTNPDPYHDDRNIALGQIDEKQLTNPDPNPNPYHDDRNIALGQIDEKQLTNPDPYHGDRNIALGQIDEKQLTNPNFQSAYDCNPIKQEGSKSSCLIDSKLDIASLFDQDIYTSALNDALKSLPSTASTSILNSNNNENTDLLFSNSIDATNSQTLHETQESDCTPSSLMPSSSTMMGSSSMPSIMSMMKNSQLDLLTDTSTPNHTAIATETPPSNNAPVLHTYKCKLCGMVFCDSELFSEHLNKHSKSSNPFMCTECGKQCSRQYDLKVHARTHTGERPYKCKFCNRGFAISRNLVAHLRIHTGERPYKCETCNKSFTQQSALRTHNRIHTGEKPYLCKACGKKFAYSYVLNSHLRNSKFYRCEYCEGMYAGACTMAQHMKSHEEVNGKFDSSILEEKTADIGKPLTGPIHTNASKIESPPAKTKPKKNSKKKAAVAKSNTKTNNLVSDLCSEFREEPIPNLDYSDLLPNPDLLSKLDDRCIKLETNEDNPVQSSNFIPDETLQIKSESILDQFSQERYNTQFAACGEELDKIFDDGLNPAPDTLLNSEQTLPNNGAQDGNSGGFGGKLSSYLKYAKHLSQRHHAMISRKVKTRPKTYVCWYCRKSFGLLKNLNKHVTDHWKKKRKYKCQYCCKMFTKETASVVHQKIHKSKKPFKCSHCSKGFVFACNLIIHQKFKHSLQYRLKQFKCQHCHQSFRRYPFYSTHLKLSHQKISYKINFQNSSVTKLHVPQSEVDNGSTDGKSHLAPVLKVEGEILPLSEYQIENADKGTDLIDSENPVVMNQVKRRRAGSKKGNRFVVHLNDKVKNNKKGEEQPPIKLSDPIETIPGNDSNFSCTFCDRTFNQRHQLIVHLRIHTGEKPYKCTWCQKAFRVSNDLNVHTRIHTGYRPYHCKVCDKTFTVLRNLSTHMRVHTGERPFQCNICAKCFSQKSALTVHQRIHTGSKPFKCERCPQSFAHSSGLRQHKQRHNNSQFEEDEFWCTFCRQAFADYSQLVVHVKTHSIESQSYDDVTQSSKFKGRSNTSETAASSQQDYDESTIKGNYSYTNAGGFDKNQSAVSNNQDAVSYSNDAAIAIKMEPEVVNVMESLKFKALTNGEDEGQSTQFATPTLPIENVQYQTSGSHRRKSKISEGVKPETMVYFPSGMNLNIPVANYGDDLKQEQFQLSEEIDNVANCFYSCDECGKVFSQKCLLEVHSRIHNDEKPSLCKSCKKSFPTANDLKIHRCSHTNERPYKCEVCGHGFSVSRNLTAHMRIHTGERPFRCEYCSKQFTQKSALTVHIRTHTGAKPFKCQHCDETFAYSYGLNTHWKQHHSTNADGGSNGQGGQSATGKVFKCGECDQTFARANMLSVHRRIHKPLNTNRGRRLRYSNNQSRRTNNDLLNSTKPLEEYLSSCEENKPRELTVMEASLAVADFDQSNSVTDEIAQENGLNSYQSQTTQYRITDKMNLRNRRPKCSRSNSSVLETDVLTEGFSKEIFESTEVSDPQNMLEVKETEDGSLQGCEVCNVCGKSFSQRAHLNAHYRIHTGERPYRCHCCPKAFRVRSDLTVHVRTHTGERPYKCRFCPKAFSISRNLTAHLRTHTGERPFPCQHCSKRFTQKSALTVHLRTHTGVRPYICMQCGETFAYSHSLKVHMKNHDKSSSLSRLIKGRSKKNLNSMHDKLPVNPQKIEPVENLNRIPTKKKQTSTRRGGRNAAVHGQQLPSLNPPLVDASDSNRPSSNPPLVGASDSNRPYPCQVCGKSFMQNSQLVAHLRIHSGERPYLCRWCPKTFRLSSDLTVHQRVHTGEKPYKCEQCGKTFSISRNLITHMRTHTGERPFPCSCCNKRFTQKSALTVHMRTHTGATPYKCDVCLETFAYSSCLSLHRKHRKAVDCNQCGKVLLGKCAFKSHMQTHETDRTFLTRE